MDTICRSVGNNHLAEGCEGGGQKPSFPVAVEAERVADIADAGDTVFLLRTLAGYGKFSYWACKGEDCPYKDKPIINSDTLKMTLSGLSDDTVAIHFNEK